MDAVTRRGDKAALRADDGRLRGRLLWGGCFCGIGRPVMIHHDASILMVDVHVRRSDVALAGRMLQLQRAARVRAPRSLQPIGIRQADVVTLMMGKGEIVSAQGFRQPVENADQRWPIDVAAHPAIHVGTDDGIAVKAFDPHGKTSSALEPGVGEVLAADHQVHERIV